MAISDWHSSYEEIMVEHVFLAFSLWFFLVAGTFISLSRPAWISSRLPEMQWVVDYALMFRASLVAHAGRLQFPGLDHWDVFCHLVLISVLLRQFAYWEAHKRLSGVESGSGEPWRPAPRAEGLRL